MDAAEALANNPVVWHGSFILNKHDIPVELHFMSGNTNFPTQCLSFGPLDERYLDVQSLEKVKDLNFVDLNNELRSSWPKVGLSLLKKPFPASRKEQTILTRFRSGHLRTLTFKDGNFFPLTYVRYSACQASPEHSIDCLRLSKQDLYEDPLMVLDF
ncbi:uncharacterized protein TNCV_3963941 [Trichonephila clavipes]|nr:uncharacterized protein TNCV_3963941 [Trichonephila clavipes]